MAPSVYAVPPTPHLPQPEPANPGLSRRQSLSLLAALALVVAVIAVASAIVRPSHARAFDLVRGSVFLADARAPVAVDLGTGKATARLVGVEAAVGDDSIGTVALVPLASTTLLLDATTGSFNMLDTSGYVIKTSSGGVTLPPLAGASTASAVAAGESAYIVRPGTTQTSVYLVNQSTVQSAAGFGGAAKPRAAAVLNETVDPGGKSTVSAGGDLWLLSGANSVGTVRKIEQLSVPANSAPGARLDVTTRATTTGIVAIASATTKHGDMVAVAGATGVWMVAAGVKGAAHTYHLSGMSGVDQILPASQGTDQVAFFYHSGAGWTLVTVNTEGDGHLQRTELRAIPATTTLAAPAFSDGSIYSMVDSGTDNGAILRVHGTTVSAVAGAPTYPTVAQESPDFSRASLLARSGRVIFNAPNLLQALVVFTDGGRSPSVIDKQAALALNSNGGAQAVIAEHAERVKKTAAPPPKSVAPPPQKQINNAATCKTTTQTPYVPTITSAAASSRSVTVIWTYPVPGPQDCLPSTYVVNWQPTTHDTSATSGSHQVQGVLGLTVQDLQPSTGYKFTVTAYLNGRGTASPPYPVTTGKQGPAAPTSVHTSADDSGNWTITWSTCTTVANGCLAVSSWSVAPTFCDGRGLSALPAAVVVPADPTSNRASATFPGGTALLGRGLRFSVQGLNQFGDGSKIVNDPTCVTSWSAPVAADMHLSASSPPPAVIGQNTSSTFTLDLGHNPTAATGGVGATFTYQLIAQGAVVDHNGPTSATTATFSGLKAGQSYTGEVTVSPPGHPNASVTIGPVPITTRASWPGLSVASAAVTVPTGSTTGTLQVRLAGLSSAQAQGERFNLVNSQFICASSAIPLSATGIDPSSQEIQTSVDLRQYYGNCSVSIQLREQQSGATAVFGGTTSPTINGSVTMPPRPTLPIDKNDFSANWNPSVGADGHYSYSVALHTNNPSVAYATKWAETTDDGPSNNCGDQSGQPAVTVVVLDQCVADRGASPTPWQVTITYQYIGSPALLSATIPIGGQIPIPVTPPPTTSPPPTTEPTTQPPVTSAPVTSAPVTSAPVTSAPVTSAPVTTPPPTTGPTASPPVSSGPPTSKSPPTSKVPPSSAAPKK
jgi:hypothetical protein